MKKFSPPKILVVLLLSLLSLTSHALPFVPTTDPSASTTKWYQLKTGNKYVYAHPTPFIDIDVTTNAGTSNDYLWCFVTVTSNRIALYNKEYGYLRMGMFFSATPSDDTNYIEEGNGENFYIYYIDSNTKFYLNYYDDEGFSSQQAKWNSYRVEEYISPIVIVPGDVTGDGNVDIADVNAVISIMLGKLPKTDSADLINDGKVDIADVNALINLMLGKEISLGTEVTIGQGNSDNNLYPISGERVDRMIMTRMIYPKSMLTELKGKSLIRLMFYPNATLPQWGCDLQVSLKEVDRDTFMGSTDDSWAEGGTVVATLTNVGNSKYLDFIFNTPFEYHEKNLLVEVLLTKTGEPYLAFFKGDRVSTSCSRNYTNGQSGSYTSFLPKATFTYQP